MNNLSGFVVIAVFGGSLAALALYFLRVPIRELFRGRYYHDDQARRVTSLRLVKMLTKKNIDIQRYLYNQPAADILKQERNCKHCRSVDQCDHYLNNKNMGIDTPFCLNNGFIVKFNNQQESLSY
ncbi:MAG: hypothetical protein OEU74_02065 [Gammaproteobacteria bacterium]|nr:hypothetical protein [Gammaproteobacteria bacterium]